MTTSQLMRLHYRGTPDGCRVRVRRHLARLTKLGLLKRMWGAYSGSVEYVYQLPTTKARTPEPHTIDIAETFVRLVEAGARNMTFRTEPWCHTRVGHVQLKPDAYLEIGGASFFLEIDKNSEWESQLTAKMRRYVQAIDSGAWPEDRAFPLVLWLVPDEARRKYIEDIIHKLNERDLFSTVLFSNMAERIIQNGNIRMASNI
nr:hypothetical protein GCM10017547_38440 [Pseudarthrobacter oxydans]